MRERLARPLADELAALRKERRQLTERLRALSHDIATLEAAEQVYGVTREDARSATETALETALETARAAWCGMDVPDWPGARNLVRLPGDAHG